MSDGILYYVSNLPLWGIVLVGIILLLIILYIIGSIGSKTDENGIAPYRQLSKEEKVGKRYETTVSIQLSGLGHLFQNVVVIKGHDNLREYSSETDMVLVNRKGIFAIECKSRENYYARIYSLMGNWELSGDRDETLLSPFVQNEKHIESLKGILGNKPFFNMVITNLKYTRVLGNNQTEDWRQVPFFTFGDNKILAYADDSSFRVKGFKSYINGLPDVLSDAEIKEVISILKPISNNAALSYRHYRNVTN